MPRRTKLAIAVALLAGALASILLQPRQPTFQNRRLTEWLADFNNSPIQDRHSARFTKAYYALHAMGPKAIPFLLARFKHEPPPSGARDFLTSRIAPLVPASLILPLQEWLYDDARILHGDQAVIGFEALGTNAASAIPQLFKLAKSETNDQVPIWGTLALGKAGHQALPQLIQIIQNQHALGRYQAMLPLPGLGTNALAAVPALIACVNDTNALVSWGALATLCNLKLAPNITVPVLITGLKAQHATTRATAVNTLGQLGADAVPAAPVLQSLLTDIDHDVRQEATNALLHIAPELLTNTPAR